MDNILCRLVDLFSFAKCFSMTWKSECLVNAFLWQRPFDTDVWIGKDLVLNITIKQDTYYFLLYFITESNGTSYFTVVIVFCLLDPWDKLSYPGWMYSTPPARWLHMFITCNTLHRWKRFHHPLETWTQNFTQRAVHASVLDSHIFRFGQIDYRNATG